MADQIQAERSQRSSKLLELKKQAMMRDQYFRK